MTERQASAIIKAISRLAEATAISGQIAALATRPALTNDDRQQIASLADTLGEIEYDVSNWGDGFNGE